MSKGVKVLGMVLLMSVAWAAMASEVGKNGMGKARTINFLTAMRVGGVLLPAGDYKVQELMDGQSHFLVFKTMNNQEKVRVHCNLVELNRKVTQTEEDARSNEAGEQVLQALAFAGEKIRHEIGDQ